MFNLSKDEISFEVVENFCREWPEGVRVEYKQEIKDIPKIVSSFANTQGGVFIVGVTANQTDNKVVFPIEGISDTVGIEERIRQSAYEGIYPPVMPEVVKVDVPDSDNIVIIVRVDESVNAPHAIQNLTRVYIRVGSVTQPYKKPELAEIDRIEYLFNRRKGTQIIAQQILDRIEERVKQFYNIDAPTMKLIARPVFAHHPVISPTAIYELYHRDEDIKRVPGGICRFIVPSKYNNHELSDNYLELNEYGFVYYITTKLCIREKESIGIYPLTGEINELLRAAREFYNACDTLVNFEVTAELENVFEKELLTAFLEGGVFLRNPVCYASRVSASTSETYVSRALMDPEQQKAICEELTMELLWAFNIPTDGEYIRESVRKAIGYSIDE